jgi:RNA polymerase sigma factor (TIGR02999 family)
MSGSPAVSPAADEFALFYGELRTLAHARLRRSQPLTLLDTTALVHETWIRFQKAGPVDVAGRGRFLAYAARTMRSIIVDFVRQRNAERRGGNNQQVTFDTGLGAPVRGAEDEILMVNQALEELAKVDERLVRLVEMRYFAGLEEDDIAASLGVSSRTVRREWHKARLLLSLALR